MKKNPPARQQPTRLLTSKETADFLGISELALRVARSRGTSPPYLKLGNSIRYAQGDLVRWLEARRES